MGQTATPAHTPFHNTGCKARVVITGTIFIVGLMDIVTGTGWTVRCSNVGREKEDFLFSKTSRPALGPIQLLIQWAPAFLPEGEQPGREVNPSPPASAEVKNEWSYTSTPATCFHGLERLNFTFTFVKEGGEGTFVGWNSNCCCLWSRRQSWKPDRYLLVQCNLR
jgi:hypothetical protein